MKDTPSKKEQTLKEQLEQDWAEDDSQDPSDLESTKDKKDPSGSIIGGFFYYNFFL